MEYKIRYLLNESQFEFISLSDGIYILYPLPCRRFYQLIEELKQEVSRHDPNDSLLNIIYKSKKSFKSNARNIKCRAYKEVKSEE